MATDSNIDVNETSDIAILLADVTQAEQTPNLQWQINMDSGKVADRCASKMEWQREMIGSPISWESQSRSLCVY